METKPKKPRTSAEDDGSQDESKELPERWSAQRTTELVLRLLRGARVID